MIKKLKSGIRHRKVRVFLIFLACSFGAWLISRLSETYSHSVNFNISYTHMPENRVLMDPPPSEIGVRIRANGFQLLGYQLSPRTLEIDLRNARESRKGSYISPQSYREQMERQLGQGIGMLQSPTDTIFMNFQELGSSHGSSRGDRQYFRSAYGATIPDRPQSRFSVSTGP